MRAESNRAEPRAFLQERHVEHFDVFRTKMLGWISFLFGFSGAFPLYIASSYFSAAIGNPNVSIFYLATCAVVLAFLFFLHDFLRVCGNSSGFLLLLLGVVVMQIPIVLIPVSIAGSIFVMGYFAFGIVAWVALDVVLEHFSDDRRSGRIRSLHLTAMNAGLLLAPFLSTNILEIYGFRGVFLTSLFLYIGLFLFSLFALYGVNARSFVRVSPLGILRAVSRRTDILRIYAVSFSLEFFYAVMIVYVPVQLRLLGMAWDDIGIVLTVMLIPFVIIQYPLGVIADRWIGEKELLIGAILVAGISTALVSRLTMPNIALWGVILFATRVGAAALEVLRDSYFYKRIDSRSPELIAFFRTAGPLANITAAAVLILWLFKFPLQSVFLLPAFVFGMVLLPAFFLEDNASEKEASA